MLSLTVVNAASTTHLDTVQPEWDFLPLACELIELRRRESVKHLQDSPLLKNSGHLDKAKGFIRLLRKLGLISDGELTEQGKSLANVYAPPSQSCCLGERTGIGTKTSLSILEQELLWMVIFQEHRFPMVAVLHQVARERVPEKQSLEPAERLAARIDHLYPEVDSNESWMPRAKVHYKWLKHLGLAKIRSSNYTLTTVGMGVFKQVRPACPNEWEDINSEPDTTLSDFTGD